MELKLMNEEKFIFWLEVSTVQQAKDRASVSGKSIQEELNTFAEMVPVLLPKGKDTEEHYFYEITDNGIENIGLIWMGVVPGLPEKSIFLMDIHLNQEHRSKGYGRKALNEAHRLMKEEGYENIFLNVLNNNFAKKLYTSMGYQTLEENEHNSLMILSL